MAELRIPILVSKFHQDLMKFIGVPPELPYIWNLPPAPRNSPHVIGSSGPFDVHWYGNVRISGHVHFDSRESKDGPTATIKRATMSLYPGTEDDRTKMEKMVRSLRAQGLQVVVLDHEGKRHYTCQLVRKQP